MQITDVRFLNIVKNIFTDIKDSFIVFSKTPQGSSTECIIWQMGIILLPSIIFTIIEWNTNWPIACYNPTDRCYSHLMVSMIIMLMGILVSGVCFFIIAGICNLIHKYINHYNKKFASTPNKKVFDFDDEYDYNYRSVISDNNKKHRYYDDYDDNDRYKTSKYYGYND